MPVLKDVYLLFRTGGGYLAPEQLVARLVGRLDNNSGRWTGAMVKGQREGTGTVEFDGSDCIHDVTYENGHAYVQTSAIQTQIVGYIHDIFVTMSGRKYHVASVRESVPGPGDRGYAQDVESGNWRPELIHRGSEGYLVRSSGDPWWKIDDAALRRVTKPAEKGTTGQDKTVPIRRSNRLIGKNRQPRPVCGMRKGVR